MSPRRYTMGAREATIAETRQRVIAAARQLVVDGDFRDATMNEVARRADVARATVYHQFGSKLGLVEGLIVDLEQRAGLDAIVDVVERGEPAQLLAALVRSGCRYWATDPDLVRKIRALADLQTDVRELVTAHDQGRIDIVTRAARRLRDAGLLADGRSLATAVDVLWLLTSFDTFDQLSQQRGHGWQRAAKLLTEIAQRQLT